MHYRQSKFNQIKIGLYRIKNPIYKNLEVKNV